MTGLFVALLAVLFLSTAIRDPERSDRTPLEVVSAVRDAPWWKFVVWPVGLVVGMLVVPVWYACRFCLWVASYVLAVVFARLVTVTAMDGRALRLYRPAGVRL